MDEHHIKDRILEFAGKEKIPLVFISYDTDEIFLACFISDLVMSRCASKVKVFIAKRDIPHGSNPSEVMLKENLLQATFIIPICSEKSKSSSWLWWETASVWAKGGKVYPLYVNISPDDFGDPIKSLAQGRHYFDVNELQDMLRQLMGKLGIPSANTVLTSDEQTKLSQLSVELKRPEAHSKKYFSVARVTKSGHVLGELFNISDQDLVDMNLKVSCINACGDYEDRDPRVIHAADAPLRATPYDLKTIRRGETKYIYNFPRSNTRVNIKGNSVQTNQSFDENHDVSA